MKYEDYQRLPGAEDDFVAAEDLSPALDDQICCENIRQHGIPNHQESFRTLHKRRDLLILLEHRDGLLHVDGPLHLHGDLHVTIDSEGKSGRCEMQMRVSRIHFSRYFQNFQPATPH